MELYFENNLEDKSFTQFDIEDIAKKVINKALEIHGCPYDTEVSLYLVDNDEIKEINSNTRNIDKATDVLSFPNIEFETIGDFSFLDSEANSFDYFNPESELLVLGDIILSYDKILEQANEYGHSTLRETAFLIAHSILHLLGYDHMTDEERIPMEDMQNRILNELKIYRE